VGVFVRGGLARNGDISASSSDEGTDICKGLGIRRCCCAPRTVGDMSDVGDRVEFREGSELEVNMRRPEAASRSVSLEGAGTGAGPAL